MRSASSSADDFENNGNEDGMLTGARIVYHGMEIECGGFAEDGRD